MGSSSVTMVKIPAWRALSAISASISLARACDISALEGFCESLAYEVAPFGIHVTLVQHGNVKTDFTDSRRLSEAGRDDQVYGQAEAKAISAMERDERDGVPAADVAAVVAKVLDARRPPRRVSVGRASERAGLYAKRLLPFRVFEASARSLGV